MRLGPTTVRGHEDLHELVYRVHERHAASVLVTDPDGLLLGVLVRDDADRALAGMSPEPTR
jgi:CBS domain-containing protein